MGPAVCSQPLTTSGLARSGRLWPLPSCSPAVVDRSCALSRLLELLPPSTDARLATDSVRLCRHLQAAWKCSAHSYFCYRSAGARASRQSPARCGGILANPHPLAPRRLHRCWLVAEKS